MPESSQAGGCAPGLADDKAAAVAHHLIKADLIRPQHPQSGTGALVSAWRRRWGDGKDTAPKVISGKGARNCWRGQPLPDARRVREGVKLACELARGYGTATLMIGGSHHIGALAAYLLDATDPGVVMSVASSSAFWGAAMTIAARWTATAT